MSLFLLGCVFGAIIPLFCLYIVYNRNKILRQQLTKDLNDESV